MKHGRHSGWDACDDFSGGFGFSKYPVQNIFLPKAHLLRAHKLNGTMEHEQQSISMEVVNPQAAGIDVGSRSHWVAVEQTEQDVWEFA